MNTCKQCKNIIPDTRYKRIFCSQSCAAKFNNGNRLPRTAESKQKTSNTLKNLYKTGAIPTPTPPKRYLYLYPYTRLYGTYSCHSCSKSFWQTRWGQKCCSIPCRDNIRSQNKCRKTQIYYFNKYENKNVILQSTWEVKIAIWLDANNIEWSRPKNRIKWYDITLQKNRTYLPDFYLLKYSIYLDVKNPVKMEQDKDKISQLISVMPLYVGDIDQVKKYVERLAGLEPACIH